MLQSNILQNMSVVYLVRYTALFGLHITSFRFVSPELGYISSEGGEGLAFSPFMQPWRIHGHVYYYVKSRVTNDK
jgi:hypothetical protein